MKTVYITAMLICSFFLSSQNLRQIWDKEQKERLGQPMNPFRMSSLKKDTISSVDLQGKITLFNFWEYHCRPCRAELRPLDEIYNRLKEYPDFQFISVASVERKGVAAYVEELGLSYDVYTVWEDTIIELITWPVYPTTIVTDREGNIIYYERGGPGKEEEAREFLTRRLEKKLVEFLNQ